MFIVIRKNLIIYLTLAVMVTVSVLLYQRYEPPVRDSLALEAAAESTGYIKYVEFNVPYSLLESALNADIKSYGKPIHHNWIELLSYFGAKYGGVYSRYRSKDLTALIKRLESGEKMETITEKMKYYKYYFEAYTAILSEYVGVYKVEQKAEDGTVKWIERYGLKVFSPIAKGYAYSHYDDFGTSRSYGYKRLHLGNDLMGSVGAPIVAVESGVVEVMGWNMYGGWRIGIRSFDSKRYYYYAHLRKNHPFAASLKEGSIVQAGDVIGYLGMTGYSTKENVNNINVPHLHFGVQLIFDEVQKDGVNQIWINVYNIVNLLAKNKSAVYKDLQAKESYRTTKIIDPDVVEMKQ